MNKSKTPTDLCEIITKPLPKGRQSDNNNSFITLYNPLGIKRCDAVYLDAPIGQPITDVCDRQKYIAKLGEFPPFEEQIFEICDIPVDLSLKFNCEEDLRAAHTRLLSVNFDENGYITSMLDSVNEHEFCRQDGLPLNTFSLCRTPTKEPLAITLTHRKLLTCGAFEMRIRSEYLLGTASKLIQDVIFGADGTELKFHTNIIWNDEPAELTVMFDLSVSDACIRNGDPAWYDVSNESYGISLLLDRKHEAVAEGTKLSFTLPLERSADGVSQTELTYALLPRAGGFSPESVVHPSYRLMYPVIERRGRLDTQN